MLKTEMRNEKTTHIDKMSTKEMLELINEANYEAVKAVENAAPQIEKAIEIITEALENGGRLIYAGAGTSGRLAVADAAECPPTFGVERGVVCALIAGGEKTLVNASENQEDFEDVGYSDAEAMNLTKNDVICGISASGGAAYVTGAMKAVRDAGGKTLSLSSNADTLIGSLADIEIITDTGPEVIQGSTRMKAGTAQKLVLNQLSTCVMIKTGKVYENIMINLKPSNKKLRRRMINIVCSLTGMSEIDAENALERNEWKIRGVLDENK